MRPADGPDFERVSGRDAVEPVWSLGNGVRRGALSIAGGA